MTIASYTVGTNQQRNTDQIDFHRRWIGLIPKSPTPEVQHIVIYFYNGETVADGSNVGYVTPETTHYVVGFAHISDFEDMYHILQSEKPIRFFWWLANSNQLYGFQIYTGSNEPVGEGPKDFTKSVLPPITH